jgi:Dolichyl-phosphate-mannose-protein mannosyltransferase
LVDKLRAVPAWGWLGAIVLGSFAVRAWLAREMVAPFIFVDELIYSELGRSFAAGDGFQVRDVPASGFSLVYPVLISPAYWLFDSLPDAYAGVKTINSLCMSLAAVPTYLLARRVLGEGLSLFAALLAVALPSLAYTGTVMTENVFYPLFLATALVFVLVLERPTPGRQVGLLVMLGLLFATRVQAVAFVPAIVVAPALVAVLGRQPVRAAYAPLRLLYGLLAAGALLVLGAQLARGRSVTDLLGAYAVVGDHSYEVDAVARSFLYHVAELDLYLGVLPFAALVLVTLLARRHGPDLAPFLAVALSVSVCILLVVSAFASEFTVPPRIQERNTFAVAPFFLIGLLVLVGRGWSRRSPVAVAVAAGAALLPLAIPFEEFINPSAISDTLALLVIWDAYGSLLFDSIDWTVLVLGALAAAALVLVPRRWALALPAATLLFFGLFSWNVWKGEYGFATERVSAGALFSGIRLGERDWIDRRVPEGATVGIIWTGLQDRFVVNQNEFFNRSVGPIFYTGDPTPGLLAETKVTVDEKTGEIRTATGQRLDIPYLVTEDVISPDGEALAHDPIGVTLWRVRQPLVVTETEVQGRYEDTWSGARVTWTRDRCRGGTLIVSVSSDPKLFDEDQDITAAVNGDIVRRISVPPTGNAQLRVPLTPDGKGTCRVVFRVAKTRVPGNGDDRALGAHFNDFDYRP